MKTLALGIKDHLLTLINTVISCSQSIQAVQEAATQSRS